MRRSPGLPLAATLSVCIAGRPFPLVSLERQLGQEVRFLFAYRRTPSVYFRSLIRHRNQTKTIAKPLIHGTYSEHENRQFAWTMTSFAPDEIAACLGHVIGWSDHGQWCANRLCLGNVPGDAAR